MEKGKCRPGHAACMCMHQIGREDSVHSTKHSVLFWAHAAPAPTLTPPQFPNPPSCPCCQSSAHSCTFTATGGIAPWP
eukprot:1151813-Pelagomonas_calceolata.AAC.1